MNPEGLIIDKLKLEKSIANEDNEIEIDASYDIQ